MARTVVDPVRLRRPAVEESGIARIDVIDTASGIPEAELAALFTVESRADGHSGGHGLGLVITRRLVTEALGGEITVDSVPGEGTTMSVLIPREAPEDRPSLDWHPDGLVQRLRDSGVFRELVVAVAVDAAVEDQIRALGARVRPAPGGDVTAVLEADANGAPPDLLVFDLEGVAAAQGLVACRLVRDRGLETDLVGLYTGTTAADRDAFVRCGCDALARKPVDSLDLVE